MDLGANDYLLKPFQSEDFDKKITLVLTKYHLPDSITKLLRNAERLIFCQKYQDALSIVDEVIGKDKGSVQGIYLKAVILDKLESSNDAIKLLEKNMKNNEFYYKNYALLAEINLKRDKPFEAITAIQKNLNLIQNNPNVRFKLRICCL